MNPAVFPEFQIGEPVRDGALAVFPLFGANGDSPAKEVAYVLSHVAMAAGDIEVEEVSEAGSVPNLRVTNKSAHRVLFLEGEELRGAKQNRVLNTSVLVAANCAITIPVSCVEQGRWRYLDRYFKGSGSHASPRLRRELKRSASQSLLHRGVASSDQISVWQEVEYTARAHGAESPTAAYAAVFEKRAARIEQSRKTLGYVDGAVGMAVAIGTKLVAADVFDKADTCRQVWERLLSGVVLQSLESKDDGALPQSASVLDWLTAMNRVEWKPAPAVGEGEELRSSLQGDTHGSALCLEDVVVHGSLVVDGQIGSQAMGRR